MKRECALLTQTKMMRETIVVLDKGWILLEQRRPNLHMPSQSWGKRKLKLCSVGFLCCSLNAQALSCTNRGYLSPSRTSKSVNQKPLCVPRSSRLRRAMSWSMSSSSDPRIRYTQRAWGLHCPLSAQMMLVRMTAALVLNWPCPSGPIRLMRRRRQ
ncbi:hypothetical protein HAX54_053068 [Datura stramonium]|uniref:Uncharacterized protein n=1 Tax=Datura stramonium TaxID=4076 RepID=A0ABS8WRA7_DATST|nr:hypothetical protein [Datura stramonium]